MNTDDITEALADLLREITKAYTLSSALYRGGAKEDGTIPEQVLRALWDKKDVFQTGFPDKDEERPFGFLPDRNALWFRRSKAEQFLGFSKANADKLYSKTCTATIEDQWDHYDELLSEPQPISELIRQSDVLDRFRGIGIDVDEVYIPPGLLVFGADVGTFWLGYRGNTTGAALRKLDLKQRAALLQDPLTRLRIEPFPTPDPLAWWSEVDIVEVNLGATFPAVWRDTLAEIGKLAATETDDFTLLTENHIGLGGQIVVAFLSRPTADEVNSVLRKALPLLKEAKAVTLLLCVPLPYQRARDLLHQPGIKTFGYGKRTIILFGTDHVPGHLSRRPWVWSRYFGRDQEFHLVMNNRDYLLEVLITDLLSRRVLRKSASIPHPALQGHNLGKGSRLRVIGRPGSGKTTSLYHLLSDQAGTLLILLSGRISAEAVRLLATILGDLQASASLPVLVAIDDLHFAQPVGNDSALKAALDLRRIGGVGDHLAIVVSYWSSDARETNTTYASLFADAKLYERVSLDRPTDEYLTSIAHLYAGELDIVLSEDKLRTYVSNVRYYDDTLATLIAAVVSGDSDYGFAERWWYWRSKFETLQGRPAFLQEIVLLRLLAGFHFLGVADPPRGFVEGYFYGLHGGTVLAFQGAVSGLRQDQWIRDGGAVLHSDNLQMGGVLAEMSRQDVLIPYVIEVLNWTVRARIGDLRLREQILSNGARLLKTANRPDDLFGLVRNELFWGDGVFKPQYLHILMNLRRERGEGPQYWADIQELVLARKGDADKILAQVGEQLQVGLVLDGGPWSELWPAFEQWVFAKDSVFPTRIAIGVVDQIQRWYRATVDESKPWGHPLGLTLLDKLESERQLSPEDAERLQGLRKEIQEQPKDWWYAAMREARRRVADSDV